MFIKLSFTANTRITVPLRILTDIINTSSITSVSTLQSRFTSASYHSSLTTNFDATNSTIIRTTSPTNTSAHFAYVAYASYGDFYFTIQQQAYDASSTKIYTQIKSASTINNGFVFFDAGSAITGGTMASTQTSLSFSETDNNSYTVGTLLYLGGNNYGNSTYCLLPSYGYDNIRTFWAYITDKCFFWAATLGTSYNSGWGSTYSSASSFSGPFFQTQYTRYDYHNTDSNGILPVFIANQRGASIGYGTSGDLTGVVNLFYNTAAGAVRVHSMVSALPQVGTSWPKLYNQVVHMTMGSRSSGNYALNQTQSAGTSTSPTATTTAGAYSSVASTRYPNATLSGTGFGMMPFGWEANYYGNHGGNASDQCGVYIFNGDYVPGDTFLYNSVLYMVWPMYSGYSNRIGFAVPMV